MPSKEKKLFLLDAMALIYRAHFTFIKNPRVNSKGVNTSAVYGFTNSLLEILESQNPTHAGIVFDTDTPTFRHKMYKEYKAQREERPEDIVVAVPMVKKLAEAFRIPPLEKEGYEADDIIGTLAKKAAGKGFEVYMMTPDKDFAQLVEDHIFMYKPARMNKPSEIWGINEVREKFGIEKIEQVVDVQGLTGDTSDNIPGVPGIGPKTAEKLIRQYHSMENLLEHTSELKGKQKELLENNAKMARLSRQLVTIDTKVPIEFDEEKLTQSKPDTQKLKQLFAELEFNSISKRLFGKDFQLSEVKKKAGIQQDLFSDIPGMEKKEETRPYKTLEDVNPDYTLVDTGAGRKELASHLNKLHSFAFDTETSGLNPHRSRIVGISIATEPHKAYYIPVPGDPEKAGKILEPFRESLENKSIEKTGQNLKYDIHILRRAGIRVRGKIFDTMIAHYLLEAEMRHNLDLLSQTYLEYSPVSIESLIGAKGSKQGNMTQLEPAKIKDYTCEDADIALQLKNIFAPRLDEKGFRKLFEKIEAPLVYVLTDMEKDGCKIDVNSLKNFSRKLGEEMQEVEKQVFRLAGTEFNLNSPKQLGEVFFDRLKLDPKARKTQKSRQYATGEDVLVRLAKEHKIARYVLDHRSIQKLKSTYVDALPELINPSTGRIHTTFQQTVAATGRLSSVNPNLQNIPIRTEKGRHIRKAFVPRSEDHTLLSADYSQIELRLVAAISQDKEMIKAFKEGEDIHASTAAKIHKVKIGEVTAEMRRQAKTVNFGIIYGISAYGLSERLGIPRKEASDMIKSYFAEYPGIRKYMDDTIAFAREHRYVKTLLGRCRRLRDINSGNATQRGFAERNAINSPIQGTAADMIKIAMVNIHRDMEKKKMHSKMILQIHDELIFDALKEELDELKSLVEEKMKTALTLDVPIIVEMGSGANWLEAH